jgi:hypothetical protein
MPSSHQFLTDWNPQKFINWGNSIDSNVGQFITSLLEVKQHPEQAYKSCIGVLSLATKVGNERLTNACKRALDYKIYNYKTIQNILERGMDVYADEKENDGKRNLPNHQNIRGENYYK